jgi:signal transduction histidine kinase
LGQTSHAPETAPTVSAPKRVLILLGIGGNAPVMIQLMAGFDAVFARENALFAHVQREILDITPPKYPTQRQELHDLLQRKYVGEKFDLVISAYNDGLDFLGKEGSDLFPGTPAISILAEQKPPLQRAGQALVQFPLTWNLAGTLERALELFPDTQHVLFVSGATVGNKALERRAVNDFAPWRGQLDFEYTSHLTLSEMQQRVAQLPPQTIIFYSLVAADTTGKTLIPVDVARLLARSANAPMFGYLSTLQNTGVVGGMMFDAQAYGTMLGHAVAAFTRGQPLAIEPTAHFVEPMFDWEQLRRWNIKSSRLPENSVYFNRPLTLWTQYQREVKGALGVVFFLVLALVFLLAENQRRRKAQLAALESANTLKVLKENTESRLLEQVHQRTSELQNEILQRTQVERRAQKEQRQFIAMVSHEFRTPLAIISATTERLSGRAEACNGETRAGYVKIQNSVDWLTALLDEYLTEERLTVLGQGLNVAAASPGDLVRHAASKAGEISARHIFQVDVAALPQRFVLDAGLMRLALLILAENAVKHTPPGTTITLSGETTPQGGLTITVADDGPGIPEDELALVLHKFYRGRQSAATYGTGLGLYLAERVIGSHGGTLVASNLPGGGAQFQICLPAVLG